MLSPEITATIGDFMRGEKIERGEINVDAPDFAPRL
jgi:hypothetical protein